HYNIHQFNIQYTNTPYIKHPTNQRLKNKSSHIICATVKKILPTVPEVVIEPAFTELVDVSKYPRRHTQHQTSSTKHPAPNIQHQTSSTKHPASVTSTIKEVLSRAIEITDSTVKLSL
ncbi:MAG: hypothetical protein RSE19_00005, partial [Myroides sp.]